VHAPRASALPRRALPPAGNDRPLGHDVVQRDERAPVEIRGLRTPGRSAGPVPVPEQEPDQEGCGERNAQDDPSPRRVARGGRLGRCRLNGHGDGHRGRLGRGGREDSRPCDGRRLRRRFGGGLGPGRDPGSGAQRPRAAPPPQAPRAKPATATRARPGPTWASLRRAAWRSASSIERKLRAGNGVATPSRRDERQTPFLWVRRQPGRRLLGGERAPGLLEASQEDRAR
jgi:hypothetical protein